MWKRLCYNNGMKGSPNSSPDTKPNDSPNSHAWTREDIATAMGGMAINSIGRKTITVNSVPQIRRPNESDFTRKNLHNYWQDRFKSNYEMIKQHSPHLAHVYQDMLKHCPNLKNVSVVDDNIESNAHFQSLERQTDGSFIPSVHFNFSHPETYLKPENLNKGDHFGFETVLKSIAIKVGVRPSDVMQNKKLVTTFIMLHEFGHAYDFSKNFYHKNYDKLSGDNSVRTPKAMSMAINQWSKRREQDLMTMPIPQLAAGYGNKARSFRNRLKALGLDINRPREIELARKRGYRRMSSERFADNFAASYILSRADEYFGDGDGKVPHCFDRPMRIMPEDVPLLDMNSSRAVTITQMFRDENGHFAPPQNADRHFGFLAENIRLGEPIRIQKGSDPYASGISEGLKVQSVMLQFYPNPSGKIVRTATILHSKAPDNRDIYYLAEFPDKEPDEVESNPADIMKHLQIGAGSKLQMMKLDQNKDSIIPYGGLLAGSLYRPSHWGNGTSPIEIGHGIHLKGKDGGNTSAIKRIYRKWKTYYVETRTSTYEVIPYE